MSCVSHMSSSVKSKKHTTNVCGHSHSGSPLLKRLALLGARGITQGDIKMACKILKIDQSHLDNKNIEDF